jgi:hypothetical protein
LNPSNLEICTGPGNVNYACKDGWNIKLVDTVYNSDYSETTFVYLVENPNGGTAISHLVYGWTGRCCITGASYFGNQIKDTAKDPSTCIYGIKFDDGWSESEDRTNGEQYNVTFQGYHTARKDASVAAIKGGTKYCPYVIDGPDCGECESAPDQPSV